MLSDAMLGYLHFIANIPVKGNRWLYSDKPYALTTPPISVINQWQVALDNGQLTSFVASLAPQHPQYAAMHESLLNPGERYAALYKYQYRDAASGRVE